jgi:type IV pilus assembly protein PilC
MRSFAYKARDGSGRLVQGSLPAPDESALREELRAQGLFLVQAKRPRQRELGFSFRGIPRKELILFTFQLQTVVSSGVPILSGLQDMAGQVSSRRFRDVILGVKTAVEQGATLSQALARYPNVFPTSYVKMIEAGETSGRLDETLDRLLNLLEWSEDLRAQVRQMVTYPSIVLTALAGLVVLLLTFVVPRFQKVLGTLNTELPLITKILVGMSAFLIHHALLLGAGLAALVAGFLLLRRIPSVRLYLDSLLLRLPVVGPLILGINANQVVHFLAGFVEAGVPINTALELLAGIVANRRLSLSLRIAKDRVMDGEMLAPAFASTGIFPPLVERMLAIGEQTGRLAPALRKAQSYYDREIPRKVKRVFDLMGPITTVLLGVVLLVVILAVLLPIYKMYTSINAGG